MGSTDDAVVRARSAAAALEEAVHAISREFGDTLGVRRLASDVERFSTDLDELGEPRPGHTPARPVLEVIPDDPYDESMWADAEHEGLGAPDRRAP